MSSGFKKRSTVQDITAGTFAGVIGTAVGHPLDTIKVRLQTQPGLYSGIWDCGSRIVKVDGMKGLFRGLASPMLSLTILNSAAFGLYGWCKDFIRSNSNSPIVDRYQYFLAGCGVGLASSFLSTPFEIVKVRMQHASGSKYAGSTDAAIRLVRAYGPTVLLTGHVINTWREMIFCTVYFGGYESLKILLTEQVEVQTGKKNPQLAILLAGGLAGVLGWLTSYPLDVIKNLKQTQPLEGTWWSRGASSWSLAQMRWHALGVPGFYKGIRPSLLRAFFVSGTRFSAFEFAIRLWEWADTKSAETIISHASASGPSDIEDIKDSL